MSKAHVTLVTGTSFEASEGDTLLRASLRAGLGFPYECNSGGCGSCQFELVDGNIVDRWPDAPGLSTSARENGRRLACQSEIRGDCRIKVRLKAAYKPDVLPHRQVATLVSKRWLTGDMAKYLFQTDAAAAFAPGQFSMIRVPGVVAERAYSMSNLPNDEGHWAFIIKRVPGGLASTALSDELPIGTVVELDGPYGVASYRPDTPRDLICIGGGSGLSPMMSILGAAVRDPAMSGRNIHFFYGARTAADLCLEELIAADPALHGRVEFLPVLSHVPEGGEWSGERGYVHQVFGEWLDRKAEPRNAEYYMCGPPPMIDAVQKLLVIDRAVPMSQVHFDRFL